MYGFKDRRRGMQNRGILLCEVEYWKGDVAVQPQRLGDELGDGDRSHFADDLIPSSENYSLLTMIEGENSGIYRLPRYDASNDQPQR